MSAIIPIPRIAINVRPGTMDDLAFIDSLQKMHTKQVGWMPTKQLEGKIRLGHVLVAWAPRPRLSEIENSVGEAPTPQEERVGYCIGHDQYFKRDDVGIIYQLNVIPTRRRSLIGATLVKAMFERAAWGCRLFCCWCAQDIEANHFWESIGFVPLAFRAGSRGARGSPARIHIFWQRRIREGDCETPYWFPSQTTSGSIREDRLVFPIPPGMHWNDEMPRILPSEGKAKLECRDSKQIRSAKWQVQGRKPVTVLGRLQFAAPAALAAAKGEKPKPQKRQKVKNDPKLVAAARELRDRWLERVNDLPLVSRGKYEVARLVDESAPVSRPVPLLLPAA